MLPLPPPTPSSSSRKRSELCISPAFGDVVAGASAPLVRPSKRPVLQAPHRPRLVIPARPRRDEDEGYREINGLALPALSPLGVRPSPSPRPVSNAVVYFDIEEQAYRWHYGSTPELGGSRAAPIKRVIGYGYGGCGGYGGGGSEDGSDYGDDATLLLTDEDLRAAAAVTRQQTRAATMKSAGRGARREEVPANDEA